MYRYTQINQEFAQGTKYYCFSLLELYLTDNRTFGGRAGALLKNICFNNRFCTSKTGNIRFLFRFRDMKLKIVRQVKVLVHPMRQKDPTGENKHTPLRNLTMKAVNQILYILLCKCVIKGSSVCENCKSTIFFS